MFYICGNCIKVFNECIIFDFTLVGMVFFIPFVMAVCSMFCGLMPQLCQTVTLSGSLDSVKVNQSFCFDVLTFKK